MPGWNPSRNTLGNRQPTPDISGIRYMNSIHWHLCCYKKTTPFSHLSGSTTTIKSTTVTFVKFKAIGCISSKRNVTHYLEKVQKCQNIGRKINEQYGKKNFQCHYVYTNTNLHQALKLL